MKEITLEWLEKEGACKPAVDWFLTYEGPKEIGLLADEMIRIGHADWVNWGLVRLMTKDQAVEYAIYAAEAVLHIYEGKYPDDDRPRRAVEAAKAYLSAVGKKERAAAGDAAGDAAGAAGAAAGDAARAAWAAWAAAGAAGAAAGDAARAAGDAAGAAWAAAGAAGAAAGDAARAAGAAAGAAGAAAGAAWAAVGDAARAAAYNDTLTRIVRKGLKIAVKRRIE